MNDVKLVVIGFVSLLTVACQPKCLQGHVVQILVPKNCTPVFTTMYNGKYSYPVYLGETCTPAHYEDQLVCDQYEVEHE